MKYLEYIFRITFGLILCWNVLASPAILIQAQGWLETYPEPVEELVDWLDSHNLFDEIHKTPDGFIGEGNIFYEEAISQAPVVVKMDQFGQLQWIKGGFINDLRTNAFIDDGGSNQFLTSFPYGQSLGLYEDFEYNITVTKQDDPTNTQILSGYQDCDSDVQCMASYQLTSNCIDEATYSLSLEMPTYLQELFTLEIDGVVQLTDMTTGEYDLGPFNSNQTYTFTMTNQTNTACWSSRTYKKDCSVLYDPNLNYKISSSCTDTDSVSLYLRNDAPYPVISGYDLLETGDGGFLIALKVTHGGIWFSENVPSYNYLLKYNSAGQLEWKKLISVSDLDNFSSLKLAKATGGNYFLHYVNSQDCPENCSSEINFFEIDPFGTVLNEFELMSPFGGNSYGFNVGINPDGQLVYVLRQDWDLVQMFGVDTDGSILWTNEIISSESSPYISYGTIFGPKFGNDGSFYVGFNRNIEEGEPPYPFSPVLKKFDFATGEIIWEYETKILSFEITAANEVYVAFRNYVPVTDGISFNRSLLTKLDANGNVLVADILENYYQPLFENGTSIAAVNINDFAFCEDGSIVIGGTYQALSSGGITSGGDPALMKIDANGVVFSSQVCGTLYKDDNENCIWDAGEIALANQIVELNPGSLYAITDAEGQYCFGINDGSYEMSSNLNDSPLWDIACTDPAFGFTAGLFDTINDFNLGYYPLVDCPLLTVSLGTPFLRRCFDNIHSVQYCNEGTVSESDASIIVTLDNYILLDSASLEYEDLGNNMYLFELGNVEVNECGYFYLYGSVDCDAPLEATACSDVRIYPNDFCGNLNELWDMSDIEVEAVCEGDSVEFIIRNIGEEMSGPRMYRVYEDNLLSAFGNFDLMANDELRISLPSSPSTYRMTAEQSPFYPEDNNPQAFIEMCGEGDFSTGFITTVPQNDLVPYYDIECRQIFGSFDPNDKLVVPSGVGPNHLTSPDASFEYTIRFQNIGNDTAFTVVVLDTLSEFLDVSSFSSGASSHPYEVEILEGRIIRWEFDNILLVDSTTNEPASNGFVRFTIDQNEGNENGTLITNSAGIYFDFNLPVITPTVFNTISDPLFAEIDACDDFMVSHDIICNDFNSTYNVILTFMGGNAGLNGYIVSNEITGEIINADSDEPLNLGPFAIGTGYSYTVSVSNNPSCSENVFISVVDCITTEIELLAFGGQKKENYNKIFWTTATEKDLSHFMLEKSDNGNVYNEIYRVEAKGNSNVEEEYSFADNHDISGRKYYRLTWINTDGSVGKSNSVNLNRTKGIEELELYPNPAKENIHLIFRSAADGIAEINILDPSGQQLISQSIESKQGENEINIQLGSLSSGLYFIQIQQNDSILMQRFVKE